jgi:hypothetical protein
MAGPILAVQPGMGEPILILTLVVIVTGGIGSIRGAFYGALIVGIVDTIGARVPADDPARVPRALARAGCRPGDRVDADLRADGGGARHSSAGPVPGSQHDAARVTRESWPPRSIVLLALVPAIAPRSASLTTSRCSRAS